MKVSTKVECGILAMADIALHDTSETVTVSSISQRQNISVKYLEQILPALRQANLIHSMKGSKGGYMLALPPEDITLKQIIDALDITILGDVQFRDMDRDQILTDVIQSCLWDRMTQSLQRIATSVTLQDIVDAYQKSAAEDAALMYYI